MCVHPRRGSALVFYLTDACGSVDARSWHGGAAVIAGGHHLSLRAGAVGEHGVCVGAPGLEDGECGKWTLQIFVALPVRVRGDVEATRAFLAEHMLPCAWG
jgi:hypothetical protein